jgi:hypothetical protein
MASSMMAQSDHLMLARRIVAGIVCAHWRTFLSKSEDQ